MNYSVIFNTVKNVCLAEGLFLLLPVGIDLIYMEGSWKAYLISSGISILIWFFLDRLFRKSSKPLMHTKDAFAIVSFSWIAISAIGALPFVISGDIPNYVDAFFETVSGFTTTGASILTNVEALTKANLFWRSFLHWFGGMGILVFIVALLGHSQDRASNILKAETPGHSGEKLLPKAKSSAAILYYIYLGLTVALILLLMLGKMPVYDSVCTALATAGTGGFGIKGDSLASYSPYIQWVVALFMLMFAVSFNIYYLLIVRKFKAIKENNELWWFLAIVGISTIVIAFSVYPMYNGVEETLRMSAFQVSTIISTTGFATTDFNAWPQLAKAILFMLMFIGGCMGSTAGGLKVSRLVVLVQSAKNGLKRSLSPRLMHGVRLNGRTLEIHAERSFLTYFTLYAGLTILTFLLISFEPFGFETNLSATVACFNNVGPGFGMVGPTGSYASYTAFSKIVLSISMLLGRLEIFPLLLMFIPSTWKKR